MIEVNHSPVRKLVDVIMEILETMNFVAKRNPRGGYV